MIWGKKSNTDTEEINVTEAEVTKTETREETVVPQPTFRPAIAGASVIAQGVKIIGKVIASSDLTVNGEIEGDVKGSLINIGPDGTISGNVSAERTTIKGKVLGNVFAKNIHLSSSGTVSGDLTHSVLVIEEGASFEGRSKRVADPLSQPIPSTVVEESPLADMKASGSLDPALGSALSQAFSEEEN